MCGRLGRLAVGGVCTMAVGLVTVGFCVVDRGMVMGLYLQG